VRFTAVYIRVPEGYIAFVEELPGANTQGDTLEEARENLRDAVALVLQANRELAEKFLAGQPVTREPFELPAP
jgi:predicted RNase H-like HicB family nuclease